MNKKVFAPSKIVIYIIAAILLVISLFPFYYMVMQSFTDWSKVDSSFLPTSFSLDSYTYLLGNGGSANPYMWLRALANSFIVSTVTAIISVIVGFLTGYSTAKMKFKGKKIISNSLIFIMFFPTVIFLVPRYMEVKGLANTYTGMILPLCVSAWAIYMFINYLNTLPNDTFEAVKIDGANELQSMWYIAIPVTKSVTTIVFLTTFMGRWSELMWDMVISPDIQMQTLNVLVSTQSKPMGNLPGPMYAASVLLTVPIVVLFIIFSKNFREGVNFMLK